MTVHEIRGQEVCHMLGLAQQMNIVSRTRTSYKVQNAPRECSPRLNFNRYSYSHGVTSTPTQWSQQAVQPRPRGLGLAWGGLAW
jgi:hypothetical protein